MNTIRPSRNTGDSPPPLSSRESQDGVTTQGTATVPAARALAPRHDPDRIRGDALRRSLYYTMIAWIPGAFWAGAAGGAPTIELANHLGASDFVLALIMTVVPLVSVLLQIPGAMVVEWIGARKKFFIWTVTPHRALYIVIGLLPWVTPEGVAWPAMVMVFVLAISMSLSNFGGQAWWSWMADLVPERVRGKYFALRSRLGIAVVCVSGLVVGLLMDLCKRPWFAARMAPVTHWSGLDPLMFCISVTFILSGIVGMFDILSFLRVDEPPMPPAPRESWMRRLRRPLEDVPFRRFMAYWSVWTAAQSVCGWIWWIYLFDFFDQQAAAGNHAWWLKYRFLTATLILGVAFQVGQFVGYPVWGRAVDRFGRKPVFFISSMLHSIGWVLWIFLSPVILPWLLLTQLYGGFMFCGQDMAQFSTMLQFNRRGGPGYQAVGSVIFSVVGALAGLASGGLAWVLRDFRWTLAAGTQYQVTFNRYAVLVVISIVIKYTGDLVFLPAVHDLEGKSRRHTLRFVIENTYGSLNTLIVAPLRAGAEITGRTLNDARETLTDAANSASTEIRRWWR